MIHVLFHYFPKYLRKVRQSGDVKKGLNNPRRLIPTYLVSEKDEKWNIYKTKLAESISIK